MAWLLWFHDFQEGHVTLPLLHLYENSEASLKKRIEGFVENENPTREDFDYVLERMRETKSIEYTLELARNYIEQAKSSGKPDDIIEKMVNGRLNKFYQENCLMEQVFIKDPDKRVQDLVTESIAMLGENISISRYIRFAIGEMNSNNGQL